MAKAQRKPTDAQIDAAKRILSHAHKTTYGKNAQGATVRALQIALAAQGYAPGRFDGSWGKKTQAAYDKYMSDRKQSHSTGTPEALSFISKELGQPLPRARPRDVGQFIGGNGAEPEPAPMPMGDEPPPAATQGPSPLPLTAPDMPGPTQAQEREYDPNVLHAAVMNRNEPADMAAQPEAMSLVSPDPNRFGPEMANNFGVAGPHDDPMMMPPNALPTVGQMRGMTGGDPLPLNGPQQAQAEPAQPPSDLDAVMGPVNDSYGLGLDEPVAGDGMSLDQLKAALVGQGRSDYPAPNIPNSMNYDALYRALRAAGPPQVAGR